MGSHKSVLLALGCPRKGRLVNAFSLRGKTAAVTAAAAAAAAECIRGVQQKAPCLRQAGVCFRMG